MYRTPSSAHLDGFHTVKILDFGPDLGTGKPSIQSSAYKVGRSLYYADTSINRKRMAEMKKFAKDTTTAEGDRQRSEYRFLPGDSDADGVWTERRKLAPRDVSTQSTGLVERINKMDSDVFWDRYVEHKRERPVEAGALVNYGCFEDRQYFMVFESAADLSEKDLEQCFRLIKETSSKAYKDSGVGWSPAKKKDEMRLPDLKYIVLKMNSRTEVEDELEYAACLGGFHQEEDVEGFMSFMVTYEDGKEVIYCYEIHLALHLIGKGFGRYLMSCFEEIGCRVGVEKAMLTVFKSNTSALKFYEKLGYIEDDYSPKARLLRNGTVKEPSYVILSKTLPKDRELEESIISDDSETDQDAAEAEETITCSDTQATVISAAPAVTAAAVAITTAAAEMSGD